MNYDDLREEVEKQPSPLPSPPDVIYLDIDNI